MAGESHRHDDHHHHHTGYTCRGGDIPSGSYSRITVTGACQVAAGAVIRVAGDIDVAAGAVLVALNGITVRGNVTLIGGGGPNYWSVENNTIGRNLGCWGLTPGVSGGFVPGAVNIVGHHASGQCAALV